MTLEELEKKLAVIRKEEQVTFKELKKHGVTRDTVLRIHNGQDYQISSLFKYLDALMYVVRINRVYVTNMVRFGRVLKLTRSVTFGYTLIDMQNKLICPAKKILAIEMGKGYTRSSLLQYTSFVNADYELMSVFDLPDEERLILFDRI